MPSRAGWSGRAGTNQAILYVEDQFRRSPDGIDIDIFFGGGVDPYLSFSEKDLLRRCHLPAEVLDCIPQTYAGMEVYDGRQRWFGACLAGFGLLYNKAVLDRLGLPAPQTWADLGRAEYFGRVASADPRLSGSMHMAYEIMLQAYGWQKGWATLVRIGGNCRGFSRQASQVPRDVTLGEAVCGMAIDTYGLRAVAEAPPGQLVFHLPQGLTVVNPDGIGVLKGAPHPELAELFVQFVLSEPGQLLWILRKGAEGGPEKFQLYRLPVIPGLIERHKADSVVSFDPFKFEGGIQFDPIKKNRRWRILNDLIGACIIDVHDELAAAWAKLRRAPADDPRVRELCAPPITEEELMRLAREKWQDPAFRAATVARWSNEARARYARLAGRK